MLWRFLGWHLGRSCHRAQPSQTGMLPQPRRLYQPGL